VIGAGKQALAAARAPAGAVALANQGETVLAWDRKTGRPLTPAIVWQDRRSAGVCERLKDRAPELAQITGLPLDPYFAAPKMTWLRENLTAHGVVTTTDTWLLARLGGGYVTDAATASRTMLLDLDAADWSARACAAFGVDPAALLAERCFAAGQAKCTYGTGAFLLATTGPQAVRSARGLSASVAWRLAGTPTYCLDGQVYTAGAAVRWLAEVGLLADPNEIDAIGGSVPDSGGVAFLPALAGLGAPHWRPSARGAFLGLGLGTTRAHLVRAAIDGLAASVTLLAGAVASDLGGPLTVLRADGGLTRSRLLMQAQADLLQAPVEVCRVPDATALGVAALARIGTGQAAGPEQAVGPADVEAVIEPGIGADEAADRMARFQAALAAILAAV